MDEITCLYPLPVHQRPLVGTYLGHNLREISLAGGKTSVIANFVTSLDGRIAIRDSQTSNMVVPDNISNKRDWRLFQELAAQADLIISSGRYLRDWAANRAQEILRVDDPEFADLKEWRLAQNLSPQPDLAIISRSLNFPMPDVLTEGGREVFVFTTAHPDKKRVREIESNGARVFESGEGSVKGKLMVERLNKLGYRTIYSAAGPKILHLLLMDDLIDRLYLTYANRLLGGQVYSTILDGGLLSPAIGMTINSVYLDSQGLDGLGQLFVSYKRAIKMEKLDT